MPLFMNKPDPSLVEICTPKYLKDFTYSIFWLLSDGIRGRDDCVYQQYLNININNKNVNNNNDKNNNNSNNSKNNSNNN